MWPYWFVMYLGNDNQRYVYGGVDSAYSGGRGGEDRKTGSTMHSRKHELSQKLGQHVANLGHTN
jgi:hypothetical protein